MSVPIQFKKEGKEIIDKIENLLPWEKGELLSYLVDSVMSDDEIEKYFIEGSGYVRWDDIDYVQGVIDNDQKEEVLDEMDDWEIMDYLLRSYDSYRDSSNLKDWMERMDWDSVAEALARIKKDDFKRVIESLINNYKDKGKEILEIIGDKLNE